MAAAQRVWECLHEVQNKQNKLVLIVGKAGTGKSKVLRELADSKECRYLDCKFLVTDELIEVVPKVRQQQAPAIMDDVLHGFSTNIFLLDGIELLFKPVLCLEPLDLLKQLSQKYSLVVAWPGEFHEGHLVFEDWKSASHTYEARDLTIIEL